MNENFPIDIGVVDSLLKDDNECDLTLKNKDFPVYRDNISLFVLYALKISPFLG
jgi:hypothetical protein